MGSVCEWGKRGETTAWHVCVTPTTPLAAFVQSHVQNSIKECIPLVLTINLLLHSP
jgi:hypothetical protein